MPTKDLTSKVIIVFVVGVIVGILLGSVFESTETISGSAWKKPESIVNPGEIITEKDIENADERYNLFETTKLLFSEPGQSCHRECKKIDLVCEEAFIAIAKGQNRAQNFYLSGTIVSCAFNQEGIIMRCKCVPSYE